MLWWSEEREVLLSHRPSLPSYTPTASTPLLSKSHLCADCLYPLPGVEHDDSHTGCDSRSDIFVTSAGPGAHWLVLARDERVECCPAAPAEWDTSGEVRWSTTCGKHKAAVTDKMTKFLFVSFTSRVKFRQSNLLRLESLYFKAHKDIV